MGASILMLQPTNLSRERILLIGAWGSGKSYSWIKLAQWMQKTGSTGKVYVLFTDFSMDRYLEGWDHPNVVAEEVGNWDELTAATQRFCRMATPDDWLVIDLISDAYDWVRDKVAEVVMGKPMSSWLLDVKGDMKDIGGSYGTNWNMINGSYRTWENSSVMRFPGHVLACARPREFMRDKSGTIVGENNDKVKELFGRWGVKAAGQPEMPFKFHTILLLQEVRPEDWRINTIRERTMPGADSERKKLVGVELKDFVMGYLIGVAKWKL